MNDEEHDVDFELQRLIRGCPDPGSLSDERRQAIWQILSTRLEHASVRRPPSESSDFCPAPYPRNRSGHRWRIWSALGTAAVAALIGLAVLMNSRPGPHTDRHSKPFVAENLSTAVARVEISQGDCVSMAEGSRRALPADSPLHVGERIQTGSGSWIKLATLDGSHLWLCPGSELVIRGVRSSDQPVLTLIRGEIRADVAHDETKRFNVETSAGRLQVLGTEFHCRVFPPFESPGKHPAVPTGATSSAMLLTVLSGAVSVQTGQVAQVVHSGQRVVTLGDTSSTQNVEQMEYIRKWLSEPRAEASPEIAAAGPIREYLLTGLWAVNPQTGHVRHVTDLLSSDARILKRVGPDLALLNRPSVLLDQFGSEPIGGSGRPLVNGAPVLVNLRTGDRFEFAALENYSALYCELSPDGRKMAFTGYRAQEPNNASDAPESGLYVLDMETLETLKITLLIPGYLKTSPHWSPDSRWIAVSTASGYKTTHSLALVDTLSGKVVETGINGADARFTPDGKQIVCCSGFKPGGSFMDGVPIWGNLSIFTIPDGKPRELTRLPKGGAITPCFSPDGAFLAYWECPQDRSRLRTLHILDMKTERDTLVTKAERHELEWLTPTTLCIAPSFIGGEPRELKIVELRDGVWTPRLVLLKSAPLAPGLDKTAAALADGVFAAFRAYRNAVSACDLHQIDKAQAKFSKARDILRQIQKKLPAGNVTGAPSQDGVCLTKNDLAPYLKEFSHEAGMTPTQRVDAIVRKNLRFSITRVLDIYVQEEQQMPESMDALARRALERGWIPGPAGAQRLVFLVPGESAEKMTTSYEIVSHDDAAGTLIVETTALPDGRRLRASFQRQSSTNGEDTTFKFPVITEVRPPETTPAR